MWPLGAGRGRARAGDDPAGSPICSASRPASGYFGSGATMANTVGLAVARHWFGRKHGVDVARAGRARAARVRASTPRRSCTSPITRRCARSASAPAACAPSRSTTATRCAWICSPRRSSATGRAGVEPAIVIAMVGSVNTGASDSVEAIADVCEQLRPVAARRRRVRRVLPALGARQRRSSPGSSAPTRWRSTATSG